MFEPEFRNWHGRKNTQKAQNTGWGSGLVAKKHCIGRRKGNTNCEPQSESMFLRLLCFFVANELRFLVWKSFW
jgi:hypothetical protein